jgi:glycosyltransferase involved in cell wall biosynthesis
MSESPAKKVLIITYYWPPSGGAGVQRWLKTVKYLREFGWEPVIYTPENPEAPVLDNSLLTDVLPGIEIIRRPIWEPYSYYKKLVGLKPGEGINAGFLSEKKKPGLAENLSVWLRGNFFIPDARKYWIKPSISFLKGYIKDHKVDSIVSTGPPHSMHLIALELHKLCAIPWMADFRDPWTGIDFYHQLKLSRFADRRHHRMERAVLETADAVTVVSKSMEEDFQSICGRNYNIVMNGFDNSDIRPVRADEMDKKFSIAHVGSIVPSRNPLTLWNVLAELVKEDFDFASRLEIKLVGKIDVSVINSIQQSGLSNYTRRIDYLPHDQVLFEMQKSHILLLLINQTPNSKGILTGKIFEYMAAQRPVICIGPEDGDASEILTETGSGITTGFDDHDALKKIISEHFQSYCNNQSFIPSSSIEMYSRKYLTGKIAGILDDIIEKRQD